MKKLFISLFFTAIAATSTAQPGRTDKWYFGMNAALDFSSGSPVVVNGSAMNQFEGCTAISDPAGNLQFYTDGVTVWNANNVQMPNGFGLMGHSSSSQSAIVLPLPGSSTIYYIFTIDYNGGNNGFRYSIVDMSLLAGLGDVTVKNILVEPGVYEKITAVRHRNNQDAWIIIHDFPSDEIFAYSFTSGGLNMVPVMSNVGVISGGQNGQTGGYLKASMTGCKLAMGLWAKNAFDVFDFDNSTGVASNHISLYSPNYSWTYGVEFSPNGRYLYGTSMDSPSSIYQFDLSLGNAAAIVASAYLVSSNPVSYFNSGMQLARDGKIYVSHQFNNYLGVIANPDVGGVGCSYSNNGQSTGVNNCNLGLPGFMASYFYVAPSVNATPACAGQPSLFSITGNLYIDSVLWNFGDPPSGTQDTSTFQNSSHNFSATGTYTVQLLIYRGCYVDTILTPVTITPANVTAQFSAPLTACPGAPVNFMNNSIGANAAQWDFGDNSTSNVISPTHSYANPGTYTVTLIATGACGADTTSQTLTIVPPFNMQFAVTNNEGCAPLTSSFTDLSGNTADSILSWSWDFGDGNTSSLQNPQHTYTSGGTYNVTLTITTAAGCTQAFVMPAAVVVYPEPVAAFTVQNMPVSLPDPTANFSNQSTGANSWQWNFGDSTTSTLENPSHAYNGPGSYPVTLVVTNSYGCADTAYLLLEVIDGFAFYIPNSFTPNGNGINEGFMGMGQGISTLHMMIFDRWGELIYETHDANSAWDGTCKGRPVQEDVYVYKIDVVDLTGGYHNFIGSVSVVR